MTDIVKTTFNLYQSDIDALVRCVGFSGSENVTQALRTAISIQDLLRGHVEQGDLITIQKDDGRLLSVIFHPNRPHARTLAEFDAKLKARKS